MTRSSLRAANALVALGCPRRRLLAAVPSAAAAGLYFADRGRAPARRAPARSSPAPTISGAISTTPPASSTPAGSSCSTRAWVHFTSEYTRQAHRLPAGRPRRARRAPTQQTFPPVQGSGARPAHPDARRARSRSTSKGSSSRSASGRPTRRSRRYPDTVTANGTSRRRSATRSSRSTARSLAFAGAGRRSRRRRSCASARGSGMLTGTFNTSATFGACVPERFLCAPEQPSWDVLAQLKVGPIFAPTGCSAPSGSRPLVRIGASFQLPVWVRAPATLTRGCRRRRCSTRRRRWATTGTWPSICPGAARAGIETRAVDDLRLELASATTVEHARLHHDDAGQHRLQERRRLPEDVHIPPVSLPRHFQDSVRCTSAASTASTR